MPLLIFSTHVPIEVTPHSFTLLKVRSWLAHASCVETGIRVKFRCICMVAVQRCRGYCLLQREGLNWLCSSTIVLIWANPHRPSICVCACVCMHVSVIKNKTYMYTEVTNWCWSFKFYWNLLQALYTHVLCNAVFSNINKSTCTGNTNILMFIKFPN